MISGSVVDDYINVWRRARTSRGLAPQGLPKTNILGRVVTFGIHGVAAMRGYRTMFTYTESDRDADMVQWMVDDMPESTKTAFEAYHLAIIRGEWCRDQPHKARALILGMPPSTYFRRVKEGWDFIAEELLDIMDQEC